MIARLRDPRVLGALVGLAVLFVVAALVPLPSIDQIRAWADAVGPMFVVVFFLVHVVVTMAPVPRTIFTVSAGVLFGAVTGITVAIAATTVSAVLALLAVRAIGRDAVAAHLTHPAVKAVDERLARRGWLAVGSLRLIAAVPFSVVNYCCGVSSIRVLPFTVATVVGALPGTVGVVLLADALTGETDPALLAVSGVCIAVGVLGLFVDARTPVQKAAVKDQA
ncbi:TVP38/TMEM64 family protein [Prescottella agglutinans]|uniref:TVP38/TMEM64 family membrane protein n=1 Tax=Prescottella agglutinans TaxID=1644129 RepID=A0A3S3ZUV8_9NOCA|nr:TVP38/TMEM64 family protein [Prescottella agglutinans]RVW08862.1 TVP38/TMEM64 family protein [Prescottella agglutinans]